MYNEPIFLNPVFQERIWGGKKLKTQFNYEIPYERTGEAWVISAHPNGSSTIKNGLLKGQNLLEAWNNHGNLFSKKENEKKEYSLLVKILDANDDLSVQVHPNDEFARKKEGQSFGKTECWYVLSAEPEAEIILGHYAKSQEELVYMIDNGQWEKLLRRIKVKEGDFFYVPSGTIHAIGKGIVVLEIQQSSDITYRVFDYDRSDIYGQKRPLHLDKAKEVSVVPHTDFIYKQNKVAFGDLLVKDLVQDSNFKVCHWKLNGSTVQKLVQDFLQVSVIKGNSKIIIEDKSFNLHKGCHFILPNGIKKYEIFGVAEFIVSWI